MIKQCAECLQFKDMSEFAFSRKVKSRVHTRCKVCFKAYKHRQYERTKHITLPRKAAWRKENIELNKRIKRRTVLKTTYGITVEDWDKMFKAQNGQCAICKNVQNCSDNRRLAVDHDHSTGRVRGLLCTTCNMGIGKLRDDPRLLEVARYYIINAVIQDVIQSVIQILKTQVFPMHDLLKGFRHADDR